MYCVCVCGMKSEVPDSTLKVNVKSVKMSHKDKRLPHYITVLNSMTNFAEIDVTEVKKEK